MAATSSSRASPARPSLRPRASRAIATLAIAIVLFFPGFALHEAMHLAVLNLIGGHGVLIVRPWRFAAVDLTVPSLHVQPAPALDWGRQLAVNFLGPALAGSLFAIAALRVGDRRLRLAVTANVAILGFYSVIEAIALFGDSLPAPAANLIGTPDFNYGVPLAICFAAALLAGPE